MITAKEDRIRKVFETRGEGEKVMSLFVTAGYPDLESTADLILGMEQNGADLIELGMPFSDPLADGPTIQYSSEVALENGVTLDKIFEMVEEVRKQSDIPLILMGYINPLVHYGTERFFRKAVAAGVDGLILPDLPPEEAYLIRDAKDQHPLPVIHLVAPNTSDERMQKVDKASEGFVYCVSVTGVTGAREGDEVARSVERFIDRVKSNVTKNPKMVGFGIKSHEDAKIISRDVDGFIVGSALIDTIREHYPRERWMEKVLNFVHHLKYGE